MLATWISWCPNLPSFAEVSKQLKNLFQGLFAPALRFKLLEQSTLSLSRSQRDVTLVEISLVQAKPREYSGGTLQEE